MIARLTIRAHEQPVEVASLEDVLAAIALADDEASAAGRPNIIFVEAPNGNTMSVVVGAGDETVLDYVFANKDPPYFASKGPSDADEPCLIAYVCMVHHTEFPRRFVVSKTAGLVAVREFVETGQRPSAVEWIEV